MTSHPVFPWLTQPRRAWLYRVAGSLGGVAIVFGVLAEHRVLALVGLVGSIVGNGTAAIHTPTKES